MKIPFFDYPALFNENENEYIKIFKDVGKRGAFILQNDLSQLERSISQYTGARFAVGVGNATDGMQIGLMAGGINQGDEVIISSHTMIATAGAIHYAGGKAIPVDPGRDLMIDPESIEKSITNKTKAIMPTQLNGRTANMDKIQAIANKYDLFIFEDAAQALGSKYKDKYAGTFGVASSISFYPAKVLGCFGDGGIVLTNDEDVYNKVLQLRDHGRDKQGNIVSWGMNSRLDNLQAAFLNFNLKYYNRIIERRRKIAGLYEKNLKDIDRIILPPGPNSDPDHFDIYQNYEIQADKRDQLKKYLYENGIGTIIQWDGIAIHQIKNLDFTQKLAFTDKLFEKLLLLPINMALNDNDINYICSKISDFYKNN